MPPCDLVFQQIYLYAHIRSDPHISTSLNTFDISLCGGACNPCRVIVNNAKAPSLLSIFFSTRSALKKRNRIGDSGDPCGRPACGNPCFSESYSFTDSVAVRSEQKASTHRHSDDGMRLARNLCSSLSLYTPLYAPLTSKLIRLSTFLWRHAL